MKTNAKSAPDPFQLLSGVEIFYSFAIVARAQAETSFDASFRVEYCLTCSVRRLRRASKYETFASL